MAYVSLGRTELLKDIFIRGEVDPEGIHASPKALEETMRLKNLFDQRVISLNERRQNFWKISYLNVRSIHGKKGDVEIDNFLMSADIFALSETWLKPGEFVTFNDFKGNFANYGQGKGVSTFSSMESILKNSVASKTVSAIHLQTEKFDAIFAAQKYNDCLKEIKTQRLVNKFFFA